MAFRAKIRTFVQFRCSLHANNLRKVNLQYCRELSAGSSADKTENVEAYDVVISGGGMVGTAMACALGNEHQFENKKILLLEAGTDKRSFTLPENYSNRVCAVSPGSRNLLEGFKAWEEIEKMRFQPVKRMQVWETCSDSLITFDKDNMTENLAYIVENDVILGSINKIIPEYKNIQILYNTKLSDIKLSDQSGEDIATASWVNMRLDNGNAIKSKLLIGADGHKSSVRQTANIHQVKQEYGQSAVVATLQLAETLENNVAWQRFLPNGPIAILPLKENLSSLVWTTTTEDAKHLISLPEESFVDAINSVLFDESNKDQLTTTAGHLLDQFLTSLIPGGTPGQRQLPPTIVGLDSGSQAMFPLGIMHATHYVKPRLALIGDAAHRIHPLAGQGVNLGFGDVACLRDVLVETLENGGDIGSLTTLTGYETARQCHVVPTMVTIDGLQKLYNTTFSPVVLLRSLGLQMVNSVPALKNLMIGHAIK